MSHIDQFTLGLLNFPVEILLDIFSYLDAYELVRARKVCNDIRQVIDSSSELLYLIDLKYFNTLPDPLLDSDSTIGTRRKLLQQSETAWQKAEYSKMNHIPVPYPPELIGWSGGILGLPSESHEQITFVQPALSDKHTHAAKWEQRSCKIDSTVLMGYRCSPAQDLVVILSRATSGESHPYDVAFRSLSEDKAHPEAAVAVAKALDNQVDMALSDPFNPKQVLFGDYYGLLSKRAHKAGGGVVDFLQIWNWKSKDAFQCLEVFDVACNVHNFGFLTNDKLLVITPREIMMYSLVESANAIQLTAKFSLPALRDSSELEYVAFNNDIPFYATTHNQLVTISMKIMSTDSAFTTKPSQVTFYVKRDTLLELESTYMSLYGNSKVSQDSPSLPWSTWGPKYTQTFEESSYDSCKHNIFGFRTVGLAGDFVSPKGKAQRRPLCIRDFNPHRVADFKAGKGPKWNQRLIEGETASSSLFLEPLGSALPYLESTTEEKFLSHEMTLEANRVTLLSFEFLRTPEISGTVQKIEVLDFE
ncbi:uncharacterized protein EDB91DRAFT_1344906 [Suillus paluster]|uniref:uncharacterized protein n=1 Tax=Suillus paluster TaxID=48578 RepID=UPI001B86102E|nr:uncharacterized protein EDB91DRAFT_1344906 [Suillus paluster]KAG1748360.1 hypothetical protein EDB91DRAFT_1344906 [Suillus paluster]